MLDISLDVSREAAARSMGDGLSCSSCALAFVDSACLAARRNLFVAPMSHDPFCVACVLGRGAKLAVNAARVSGLCYARLL